LRNKFTSRVVNGVADCTTNHRPNRAFPYEHEDRNLRNVYRCAPITTLENYSVYAGIANRRLRHRKHDPSPQGECTPSGCLPRGPTKIKNLRASARTLARTLRIEKHGKYGTLDDRRRVVVNGAVTISY
jgi:hypothetical protein